MGIPGGRLDPTGCATLGASLCGEPLLTVSDDCPAMCANCRHLCSSISEPSKCPGETDFCKHPLLGKDTIADCPLTCACHIAQITMTTTTTTTTTITTTMTTTTSNTTTMTTTTTIRCCN